MNRFLIQLVVGCIILLVPTIAHADSMLDATLSFRYDSILDRNERADNLFEVGALVGLSQTYGQIVTFGGGVGLFYTGAFNEPFEYSYEMKMTSTRNVWGIGILGQATIHLPNELFGLSGGLNARTFFMPTRSGVFRVDAFVGITSKISLMENILQGFIIGVRYHFQLIDDFEDIFDISSQNPHLSLYATWQF